ncbi:MAG: glycogen synthase, partial [Clostridia bacterium]|nr:glycogen synthase [Clostridia bacterium]
LASIYLKTEYCKRPEYQYIRSHFTSHNIEYQGKYSLDILGDLFGIHDDYRSIVEYGNCINLMKGAIECSEKFSTVSPTYANEIKSAQFAHGLEDIIRRNENKLCGILNGIDVNSYNPATDKALFANYTPENMENKAICKAELQKMLGLPQKDVPIISMITRLVSHKGIDLVKTVIEDVLHEDVQFILLGTGDFAYETYFKDLGRRYHNKISANIIFNGDLSRKIYSGSDIFLMPSMSEPCGLSQMIASRYATVPVVRETGGLYDSIKPFGAGGNGFTFASTNPYDMLYVINEALSTYKNKEVWQALMKKAATTDFSWQRSAEDYKVLYQQTISL